MQDLAEAVLEQAAVPSKRIWIDTGVHFCPLEDPYGDPAQEASCFRVRQTAVVRQFVVEKLAWTEVFVPDPEDWEGSPVRPWEPLLTLSDATVAVDVLPAPTDGKWRIMADDGSLQGEELLAVSTAALAARVLATAVQA